MALPSPPSPRGSQLETWVLSAHICGDHDCGPSWHRVGGVRDAAALPCRAQDVPK